MCVPVRRCVFLCVRAHSHLCIGLFLCSLRSTLGQTQLTTAATLSQTLTTGERRTAAGAALLSLVYAKQLCSAPPSLKKSSAELKRILSNGQVSTFLPWKSLPACCPERPPPPNVFPLLCYDLREFEATNRLQSHITLPLTVSLSVSTQEHTSTQRAASVSERQLNSQLLRFTAVTQLTNRAVLALLLPLIHS